DRHSLLAEDAANAERRDGDWPDGCEEPCVAERPEQRDAVAAIGQRVEQAMRRCGGEDEEETGREALVATPRGNAANQSDRDGRDQRMAGAAMAECIAISDA